MLRKRYKTNIKWKLVCDGYYEVSNTGIVRSVRYNRELVPQVSNGYLIVGTQINGNRRRYTIHSLVAQAFIGNKPFGMEITHKDLNRKNNHTSNLEYVTKKRNCRHARDNYTTGQQKLTWKEVKQIRKLCKQNPLGSSRSDKTKLSQRDIGKMFGITDVEVSYIASGKVWNK